MKTLLEFDCVKVGTGSTEGFKSAGVAAGALWMMLILFAASISSAWRAANVFFEYCN
jgi:hypothetical protein